MILFLLLKNVISQLIAIDFGSTYVKAYKTKFGKEPEIALNLLSKRYTPAFISYKINKNFTYDINKNLTDENLYSYVPQIGERAVEALKQRASTVSGLFTTFIDRDVSILDYYQNKFNVNHTAYGISHDLSTLVFLKHYFKEISYNEHIDEVTVVVPAVYTIPQRQFIKQYISACGYAAGDVIDDVDAMIYRYVFGNTHKIVNSSKVIVFIDIGGMSTKVYAVLFNISSTKSETVRLYYNFFEDFGGQHITHDLTKFIVRKYRLGNVNQEEYHKIFEVAERIKIKLISTLIGADVLEDFRDKDMDVEITRNEFEDAIKDSLVVLKNEISFMKKMKFDDIELFGLTSKIPVIRKVIQEETKVKRLGNSLSPDDSLASGAAIFSTTKSGFSKYRPIKLENIYPLHTLNIIFSVQKEVEEITVCNIESFCMDRFKLGGNVAQVDFKYTVEKYYHPYILSLRTRFFGYDLFPSVYNATLYFNAAPFYLTNAVECIDRCTEVNLTEATYIHESPNMREFYSILARDILNEELIQKSQSIIYTLSTEAYDQIINNATVHLFSTPYERNQSLLLMNKTRDWALLNRNNTNGTEWSQKASSLSNDIMKYAIRIRESQVFPELVDKLNQTLDLVSYFAFYDFPLNRSFVGVEKIIDFQKLVNRSYIFLHEAIDYKKKHLPQEDWSLTSSDIQKYIENISASFYEIVHAVPPYSRDFASEKLGIRGIFSRLMRMLPIWGYNKDL